MFRYNIDNVIDFARCEKNTGEDHKKISTALRKKSAYQTIESLTINDLSFFPNFKEHPIMFDDIYIHKDSKKFKLKQLPKLKSHQKSVEFFSSY